ncbi:MAG: S4 domain-containing protein [Vicinamibacterales bacterium]|nr:S4 domain-containing protein [Vicinamibacterales bacterium]
MPPEDAAIDRARLDVWLDVACLFKTRSEAQRYCRGGKVDVNGQRAKPHRTIQNGDRLSITRPNGRRQQVVVRSLATQHVPRATARALYDDVTPAPTAAELELFRLGGSPGGPPRPGSGRSATETPSRPDKRQRRSLRRLKDR